MPRAIAESFDSWDSAESRDEVLVLEPRRLAARLAAHRVAEEIGERVGGRIGYAVRFEQVASARTRLRFVTQGVLLRRLLGDRGRARLDGVRAVVLDEFHQRALEGDVALALLRALQRRARPDLLLVAMSATLDAEPVARFLGGCPRVRSEGRRFDVAIEYAEPRERRFGERPLEQQVAAAVRRLLSGGLEGDVLVFLPGAREIRRAETACAEVAARADLMVVALHGEQSPAEQDRAIRPAPRRKVILSTNVAETSVTIDGVVAVVDSGLARVATHSPWSGLPSLRVARISRASAAQRAGRAGRTRPGRAIRLYTRHDHDSRPEFDAPEVRRADLAETVLLLRACGVDPARFEWFEPPPDPAVRAADALLIRLGALDAAGRVTGLGERLLRLPLHPRLARILCEAESRGVAAQGAAIVAWLGEARRGGGSASWSGASSPTGGGSGGRGVGITPAIESGDSDVLAAVERREGGPQVERAQKMLARLCTSGAPPLADNEQTLLQVLLTGFPDRIARRRRPGSPEVLLSGGGAATLSPASVVREADLMVALEAEEQARREPGGPPAGVVIRTASAIEPEWLLELDPAALREADEVCWDPRAERVRAIRRLRYDELVLEERELREPDAETVARVLAAAAVEAGPRSFADGEALARLQARLAFVAAAKPDAGLRPFDEAALAEALTALCSGRRSFVELREAGLLDALRARLDAAGRQLLDRLAPERITLPGGRAVRVEYQPDRPPFLASRLQDFFGLVEGPRVAGGDIPVTLHLLAPNQRAVQVTADLAGFWERHYPSLRRELMRRYPKHAWPEDPRHAQAPRGGRPR